MRLFVIGHYYKGKSTLIAALRRSKQSSFFDNRVKRLQEPDFQLTDEGMTLYTHHHSTCTSIVSICML